MQITPLPLALETGRGQLDLDTLMTSPREVLQLARI
jgi:hypothetical protein